MARLQYQYLLLAVTLAPVCLAFPRFVAPIFGESNNSNTLKEKVVDEANLAARMMYEKVMHFESSFKLNDPNIPEVVKSLGLSFLLDLVVKTGLAPVLLGPGPLTVFGPTDKAFEALPEWEKIILANKTMLTNLLKFHVLPGNVPFSALKDELLVPTALDNSKLRINIYKSQAVTVVTAQCAPIDLKRVDNKASNGLVHVLNSVMFPPAGNIVQAVGACPVFKTLVAALTSTKLAPLLSGEGPFTLFAPTDEAFNRLPRRLRFWIFRNITVLTKVLENHVVPLTYCSAGLATGLYGQFTTLAKHNIAVTVSVDGIQINNARVISPDGSVSNGVVHGIDTVLLPPVFNYF